MHISKLDELREYAHERKSLEEMVKLLKQGGFLTLCAHEPQLQRSGTYVVNGPVLKLEIAEVGELLSPLLEAKLTGNAAKLTKIGVGIGKGQS